MEKHPKTLYAICSEMKDKGYNQITLGHGRIGIWSGCMRIEHILIFSDLINNKIIETYESVLVRQGSWSSPQNLIFEGKYTPQQFEAHKNKFKIETDIKDNLYNYLPYESTTPAYTVKLFSQKLTYLDLLDFFLVLKNPVLLNQKTKGYFN